MFNYAYYTDKCFLRSKEILKGDNINPTVRCQIFARKNVKSLKGINEAIDFIRSATNDNVKIYTLREGDSYKANEPIMKLEGKAQDLIDLETVYLGIISDGLSKHLDCEEIKYNAIAIKDIAKDKKVYYFGARHYNYNLDKKIGKICIDAGFDGTSTDAGSSSIKEEGVGTTPHALFLIYQAHLLLHDSLNNSSICVMKAFDRHMYEDVPRTMLNCTFNKEITDFIGTYQYVPSLTGVRIDTCGENNSQGINHFYIPPYLYDVIDEKYLYNKGVSVASVWALRRALALFGLGHIEITVSSGFNVNKVNAFMIADEYYNSLYDKPLFDVIGTGSLSSDITMATSDIVAYKRDSMWIPLSKVGRSENFNSRLERM